MRIPSNKLLTVNQRMNIKPRTKQKILLALSFLTMIYIVFKLNHILGNYQEQASDLEQYIQEIVEDVRSGKRTLNAEQQAIILEVAADRATEDVYVSLFAYLSMALAIALTFPLRTIKQLTNKDRSRAAAT